jgi:type I restriction enzyme, S subunit
MAKAEWKPRKLDELGFVGRGKSRHRPRNDSRLYGGPYPFVQTADIMAADPYITGYSQTYTEFGLQQSKLWPSNTLCITIAGANTAETAILKFEACFPDSVIGFIADETKSDLRFVKYSLDLMKERFRAVTRGTTQDNLSLDKLLSFPIPTPKPAIQHRIGDILSAYDDLMENCRQQIRILERMARRVYREWFYREQSASENATTTFGEICEALRHPFNDHLHRLLPLVDLSRIPQRSIAPTSSGTSGELTTSRIIFERGDTLFGAIRSYLHKVVAVHFRGVTNTSVLVLRPKQQMFRSLVAIIASDEDTIRWAASHSSGTKMPVISWDVFQSMPIPTSNAELARRLEQIVGPMLDRIALLTDQIQNLRRTRDLLFPRLLTGQIDLRTAEEQQAAA